MITRLAALTLAVCFGLVACDSDGPAPVVHTPAPTHVITGPTSTSVDPYTLDLLDGAKTVQISVGDLHGRLYRIATPVGTAAVPSAHVVAHTVNVTLAGGGDAELAVTLARSVQWNLRFSAGVTTVSADMGKGDLAGLTAVQGISTLDVTAENPSGKIGISELGGVSVLALHTSATTPVTAVVAGGAGSVSIFGKISRGVAGGRSFASPSVGPDSYNINAVGGVGALTVDAATR